MLKNLLKTPIRALFGPPHTWRYAVDAQRQCVDLRARLDDAFVWASENVKKCSDEPVFILSAGWRSGSTLLQRMLMQNNERILIWGEPFHQSNILDCMMNQFRCFTAEWPKERHFLSRRNDRKLSDQWIANLYPDVDFLIKSHRQFFDCLFAEPARSQGCSQWGLKEVRLTIDHANYLRALYPQAKIILLCRNPFEAYRSFFKVHDAWFAKWPIKVVATPYAFGKQWKNLTEGYFRGYEGINAVFVRYEMLEFRETAEMLERYVGWRVSPSSALATIVGENTDDLKPKLPTVDKVILASVTSSVRRDVGY